MNMNFYNGFMKQAQALGIDWAQADYLYKQASIMDRRGFLGVIAKYLGGGAATGAALGGGKGLMARMLGASPFKQIDVEGNALFKGVGNQQLGLFNGAIDKAKTQFTQEGKSLGNPRIQQLLQSIGGNAMSPQAQQTAATNGVIRDAGNGGLSGFIGGGLLGAKKYIKELINPLV